ncbi:hypothetical protein N7445_010148 [Penicillium cf. griseofulvum]|nr:hypothetical protein N7445_010148 [Penicillium cf. griseofulvum]
MILASEHQASYDKLTAQTEHIADNLESTKHRIPLNPNSHLTSQTPEPNQNPKPQKKGPTQPTNTASPPPQPQPKTNVVLTNSPYPAPTSPNPSPNPSPATPQPSASTMHARTSKRQPLTMVIPLQARDQTAPISV